MPRSNASFDRSSASHGLTPPRRRAGADHIFWSTQDAGECTQHYPNGLVPEFIRRAIILTHWGASHAARAPSRTRPPPFTPRFPFPGRSLPPSSSGVSGLFWSVPGSDLVRACWFVAVGRLGRLRALVHELYRQWRCGGWQRALGFAAARIPQGPGRINSVNSVGTRRRSAAGRKTRWSRLSSRQSATIRSTTWRVGPKLLCSTHPFGGRIHANLCESMRIQANPSESKRI